MPPLGKGARVVDPTGAWIGVAGRLPGSKRKVQVGSWIPVAGRKPGSRATRAGRDSKGRFARVSAGPEAHYEWSADRRLTYWYGGIYRYEAKKIDRRLVRRIVSQSIVDLGPAARWRLYLGPHRVTYYGPGIWAQNGRRASTVQAAHRIAENIAIRGEILTGLQTLLVDPEFEDVVEGVSDHAFELGTAEIALPEIKGRYRTMPGGSRSSDVAEERPVPFERVDEDVLQTMRRVWVNFDTGAFDKEAFGAWLKRAKGLPVLISYYVVAHRVVYIDDDVVMWGETIQTRFVPFGRGDGYQELVSRVQDMIDKSDEEVVFVAGGIKLLFEELLS